MSDKKGVQYNFQLDVKGAAMNLADKVIGQPEMRANYYLDFKKAVMLAIEKRDQSLADLEIVRVKRVHLQTLVGFVKRVGGFKESCFGEYEDDHELICHALRRPLCPTCKAISPLLKEDC